MPAEQPTTPKKEKTAPVPDLSRDAARIVRIVLTHPASKRRTLLDFIAASLPEEPKA